MTANAPCAIFRESLLDYLDEALHPAVREAARAHERSCAGCAGLVRSVREQRALLSALPRPAAPENLGARIERALASSRRAAFRPRRWTAWTAAAAAAAVVAIGLLAGIPRLRAPERSITVIDVELPDRGTLLGRFAPSYENPTGSLLDPLVSNENP
ncbi:MAG TPA: hypothetical protein VGK61_02795 [Planctomycetota bacterium]